MKLGAASIIWLHLKEAPIFEILIYHPTHIENNTRHINAKKISGAT
jgi:hypothetical protein